MEPIKLFPHFAREITHFKRFDIEVPKALLEKKAQKPDLSDFPYPLPQKKSDYTCFCEGEGGVIWYGSAYGVTRYDESASLNNKIMYFSAQRDLLDNHVNNLLPQGDGVWVLTDNGVTHIEMLKLTCEKKAEMLLEETKKYASRHSMVSHMRLSEAGNLKSVLPYGYSPNDGSFTCFLAIGEIFHYAEIRREKGPLDEETIKVREYAQKLSEAALLLMYISGRGDGFVARTYLAGNEPVPDSGIFFKKNGEKAICLNTEEARKRGIVGLEVKGDSPIPERLKKLYTDEGYEDNDITYMGDTSCREITLHFMHLLVSHEFLGREDAEYDSLLAEATENTINHIIKNNLTMVEADLKPTGDARWDEEYFNEEAPSYNASLNSAEILLYLEIAMRITGREGKLKKTYDKLIKKGYNKLTTKHFERLYQSSLSSNVHYREKLSYEDQEIAAITFWGLLSLERKKENRELYINAIRSWRTTMACEFNPGYDFLYAFCDDEYKLNEEMVKAWFYRFTPSRLAGGVSLKNRRDIPTKTYRGSLKETAVLLTPDENYMSKYDHNPYEYKGDDISGIYKVESCYPYTFAYWIGRYFKFIEEAEENG